MDVVLERSFARSWPMVDKSSKMFDSQWRNGPNTRLRCHSARFRFLKKMAKSCHILSQSLDTWLGNMDQLRKDVFLPAVHKHLSIFEKSTSSSGSGFLVGDSVTWADLGIAEFIVNWLDADILSEFPALKALQTKMHEIPNIKKWRATRRETFF